MRAAECGPSRHLHRTPSSHWTRTYYGAIQGKQNHAVVTLGASICMNTVNLVQRKAKLLVRDRKELAALTTQVNANALLALPPTQSKGYGDI